MIYFEVARSRTAKNSSPECRLDFLQIKTRSLAGTATRNQVRRAIRVDPLQPRCSRAGARFADSADFSRPSRPDTHDKSGPRDLGRGNSNWCWRD
jgi:hypothetical protein